MSQLRLLQIMLGVLLGLALLLWLITTLAGLYSTLATISTVLANVMISAILVLIVGLLVAVGYYGYQFLRPQQERFVPRAPEAKGDAAVENLRAVEQQLNQVQDEIERQALEERSREIQDYLARGELRLVVFGTGSAGKTSLVNAMLGEIAGATGAAMGTTTRATTYKLRLRGVEREIWLTDTPGILEAGIIGTEREQGARKLATEADLILFVVDNDLRKSEYDPLKTLAQIGKRSILVFNKTDLYPNEDVDAILHHLRERVQGFIAPVDVIAVSTNPQAILLESGDRFQSQPEILPLMRRIADILRTEGEDLIADNILLQSQRLGEEARQILATQRRRQADQIVDRYQWISAGVVSVTPLPMVDLLATVAVHAQMVIEIGKVYGCDINIERGKELAVSLAKTLVSLGIVRGALELLTLALQTNVGTFVIGRAIHGATAAYLTRIAGKSFIEYFRRNQTWGDGGMTDVVQEQFQLNRRDEFIKIFAKEAIARVVDPLKAQMSDREQA
ncbi:YcjF family protein [Leptolyngbya sp. AN02str]|uniref:YcjF family protein n=1 Tax=Leptolyngbya sp. AN02str TaxID=3423363 RepID=UPI003D317AC3